MKLSIESRCELTALRTPKKLPPAPGQEPEAQLADRMVSARGGVHDRGWKFDLLLIEVAAGLPISKVRIMQRLRLGETRVCAPLKEGRRDAGGRR